MNFAITSLTHNDNYLFLHTLSNFLCNTNFKLDNIHNFTHNLHFYILLQNCSKAFTNAIHSTIKYYNQPNFNLSFHILEESSNLGIAKANNKLAELTKDFTFVLHLEDDWILSPTLLNKNKDYKNWLLHSLHFLLKNPNVSTFVLRKYNSETEKYKYGWTRNIPYMCHTYKDNFNYQNKCINPTTIFTDFNTGYNVIQIEHFLFTFNPVIRRNKDYYNSNVFPLVEYDDQDSSEDLKNKGQHSHPNWGFCEAFSMEKTRHLTTYTFLIDIKSENSSSENSSNKIDCDGCFSHFDDSFLLFKESGETIFSNFFTPFFNINCHIPILIVYLNKINTLSDFNTRLIGLKHDFILPLQFYWDVKCLKTDEKINQFKKVLSKFNPKVLITVGSSINFDYTNYLHFIPFEYRKRWLHFTNASEIQLNVIEYCMFHSMFKHTQQIHNPIISIITPAYESKHRILRPFYSLLNQTYTNWEWIIIDDSKTDECWKKLTEFAQDDYRIQVYKRPSNDGSIGKNKHFCGSVARGKFIFELDHDDDILPSTFDLILNASKKYPDAGFFYSDFIECYEDTYSTFNYGDHFGLGYGSYYKKWWHNDFHYVCKTPRINPHTLRHIVGVPNHLRCWTKEAYLDVGGHSIDLSVVDDYELIIRTLLQYRWCHLNELLYIQYRNHGGDNFTFHRNALIQYLVKHISNIYNQDISNRLQQLGINDDVKFNNHFGQPKSWEKKGGFDYPFLEYIYNPKDQSPDNPLISIIIPTFNRSDHLQKALDSVFSQTYTNFEVFVIGDKCPTLDEFVKKYPNAKDPRFSYYNLTTNGGPGGHLPRNYALKMLVSSQWIAYLDDDNSWTNNHLEHLVNVIRNDPELEFVFSSMIIDGKELLFDIPRRGRLDTSCVLHRFDLCTKNNVLWKNRIDGHYWHDWTFFDELTKGFSCKWKATKQFTLLYSTEFNSQSYEQLIQI
jgi:glycosyltransferase involved in cell wall biosynthesis